MATQQGRPTATAQWELVRKCTWKLWTHVSPSYSCSHKWNCILLPIHNQSMPTTQPNITYTTFPATTAGSTCSTIRQRIYQKKKYGRVSRTCPNCDNDKNKGLTRIEKQHICHYSGCGKTYEKPCQLLDHLRWHMDEKLYICNWLSCGKRFITLQKPQQHRYVHPSEKKYVCKECSNKFKCRVYLIRHQKKQEKQLLISNFSGYDQSQLDVTKSINHTFINLTRRNIYTCNYYRYKDERCST